MPLNNLLLPRIRNNYAWFLILAGFFLLSTRTLFNVPVGIMSLLGLCHLVAKPRRITGSPGIKMIFLVFLLLWLPMLVSLPDAADMSRSVETVILYLHYPFAAVFIAISLRDERNRSLVTSGIFLILSFWCLDAIIQFFAGRDIFGYPYTPPQLAGMFYPKIRLGYIVAVMSPFLFEHIRQRIGQKFWLVLMIIPICVVVLLSGKRVAWMMFLIAIVLYFIYLWIVSRTFTRKIVFPAMFMVLATGALAYTLYEPFQNRVAQTLGIFSNDYEQADIASARRLELWKIALTIYRANWLNGVGPRNFRHVYAEYADADNFWINNGQTGQTHPHQFLLEIAAETGMIGITGYLLFWLLLIVSMRQQLRSGNRAFVVWSLCVIVALCPLNAHLAFYGSYWSSTAWLLLALALASLEPPGNDTT